MLKGIKSLLGITSKADRQRQKLLKPEYGYLFEPPPSNEWVSLDLEMTGLNPKTDHILSVGAVKISLDQQPTNPQQKANPCLTIDTGNALSLVCRPPVMPSTDSIVIHGLRPIDVENGISYEAMLAQLLPFIGSRPVVGFCVDMDMAFINQLVKPLLGATLVNEQLDVSLLQQRQQQRHLGNAHENTAPRKHLNQLLDDYGIPRLSAHDALHDALMTAMLFAHLQPAR